MTTLYEDWQARRERLRGRERAFYCADQARVLDYLLQRYAGDPTSNRPARCTLLSALILNSRAIVVHHHLGRGVVRATGCEAEARVRARRVLERIAAQKLQEVAGPPGNRMPFLTGDIDVSPESLENSWRWHNLLGGVRRGWIEVVLAECCTQLATTKTLPEFAIRYLAHYSLSGQRGRILKVFMACDNPSALAILVDEVLHWSPALPRSLRVRVINHVIARKELAADKFRAALLRPERDERCKAAFLLARMGDLNDIALFEDLLAVPEVQTDEIERRAYVFAMERLAKIHVMESAPVADAN